MSKTTTFARTLTSVKLGHIIAMYALTCAKTQSDLSLVKKIHACQVVNTSGLMRTEVRQLTMRLHMIVVKILVLVVVATGLISVVAMTNIYKSLSSLLVAFVKLE